VRHCVPPSLSLLLACSLLQPQYLACISYVCRSLSLALRVDLSISQPSEARQDT